VHRQEKLKSPAELPCAQTNRIKDGEEPGPDTELEYWRVRMSNFNSITEQLKLPECRAVLAVTQAAKTRGNARWRSLDIQVRAGWQLWSEGGVHCMLAVEFKAEYGWVWLVLPGAHCMSR
jgi:hypothetical protein